MMNRRRAIILAGGVLLILAGCHSWPSPKIVVSLPEALVPATPTPSQNDGHRLSANTTPPPDFTEMAAVKMQPTTSLTPIFYPELAQVSVSSETSLVHSPAQSHAVLPLRSIRPGEAVQLVVSDQNGAWLLLLHQNTLGWMPSVFLGFGSGSLSAPVLNLQREDACFGYQGSITGIHQDWRSANKGNFRVNGLFYVPSGQDEPGNWTIIRADSGIMVEPQVTRSWLAPGGIVGQFSAEITNLSIGENIQVTNSSGQAIPLLASVFSQDCSNAVAARSDIAGSNSSEPTQAPTVRMITLQVVSTSEWLATPYPGRTAVGTTTPWAACANTYLSRFDVGDRGTVSKSPPSSNRVRRMPYIESEVLGHIDPDEKFQVIKGPSCSSGYVWWKIRSEKDGLTGWTAEGSGKNYWLDPISEP